MRKIHRDDHPKRCLTNPSARPTIKVGNITNTAKCERQGAGGSLSAERKKEVPILREG